MLPGSFSSWACAFLHLLCFIFFSAAPLIPWNKFSALRDTSSLYWFLILAKVTPARPTHRDFTTAFPRMLTTKGYGSGNYTGGVGGSLLAFSEFGGCWIWERDEKWVSLVAWMFLGTWDSVCGEGMVGTNLCWGKGALSWDLELVTSSPVTWAEAFHFPGPPPPVLSKERVQRLWIL